MYANNQELLSIHKVLYNEVNFLKIADNVFSQFMAQCLTFADINNESFFEKLAVTLTQNYKKNKNYSPESQLFDRLTLEQLEGLGSKVEELQKNFDYIGKIFEKRFHFELDNENKDSFTLEERREQLIQMYDASENRPQSFKSALLLEILENGVKLDIYDKKYFVEYLRNPLKTWHMKSDIQKKKELHNNVWTKYISNMQNRKGGIMDSKLDSTLYKKYLEKFYADSGSIEEFSEFFDQEFIFELSNEFDYYEGKETKKTKVSTKEAETMKNMVLIELLECNKQVFKREDRVKLVTEIKNVPTLHIKIFEFNSENYYRKTLSPFRTDVNLDGLITAHEETHEFIEPPQKKFRHVFEFPQLDDRVGLFVIEFISNGYSSRAVIKKGSLSLIFKSTVAGQTAYILDENKNICDSIDTGIWYKNQYYKANPDKGGRIIIPYQKQASTGSAILIHDGFAQLAEFRLMAEQYSFDVAYIVHPEGMLMGKEAEILLLPTLKVNDRKCDLSIMRNTKITLTTISFIDNLPITKTFDDLSPNSQNEISIKFQVPPNLQSVSIQIQTEVMNISKGKTEQLSHSHQVSMTTKNETLNFYDCYLRKYKGEYYFYVLGKNGEALADVSVMFTFSHQIYTQRQETVSLNTDHEGKINLGLLIDITRVNASFNGPNGYSNHDYKIESNKERVSLPGALNILEDEQIELPFICSSEFSEQTCSLIRYADNTVTNQHSNRSLSNCFSKINYSHEDGYQYGKICISGLERGYYLLSFNTNGIAVALRVHKGVYWETDSFILKDHSLVEKRDTTNLIRIKNVDLEEHKEDRSTLKFNLSGYTNVNRTRAHVVAYTFEPTDPCFMFDSFHKVSKDWAVMDIFPFAKWQNIFLSNRKLSDEFRYVFDRKIMTKLMGGDSVKSKFIANNTLDKPQLLLNRFKIRDTQYDQEVSNEGQSYKAAEEAKIVPQQINKSNVAPVMQQQIQRDYSAMRQNIAPMNRVQLASTSSIQPTAYYPPNFGTVLYKSFQNFLDNSVQIISNLVPDENGNVECKIDAEKYSAFAILALDENTVTQVLLSIDEAKSGIAKRDLSLTNPLNPHKNYNETRNTIVIKGAQSHQIEDITSSDYFLVDSLERVQQIQVEIQKLIGYSSYNEFEFVTKWPTYSEEDKNKKYSKFMSHELNLFLYFKDKAYFEKVVRPFISNKMEKTFIDYWLLGNYDDLASYADLENYDKLNTLEK